MTASSIRRSIQVIDLLSRKSPLGVRAVAQQLKIPVGSVHRLLFDLAEEGVVAREASGEWVLSYRILSIGRMQLERIQLPALARPFAEKMAAATKENVNITALGPVDGFCVDKVRGIEGMQLDMPIGSRGMLHCGGGGKAMLAYLSPQEQMRRLDGTLIQLTPHTLTDRDALNAELGRIRARGYAIDDQEVVMGVYCVSMPIFDATAQPVGAISITGPSVKQAGPGVAPLVAMLTEACGHISRRMGYAERWPRLEPEVPVAAMGVEDI